MSGGWRGRLSQPPARFAKPPRRKPPCNADQLPIKGERRVRAASLCTLPRADQRRRPRRHWRPLLPARAGVAVEDIDVFAGHCLIHERRGGLPALSILRLPRPDRPPAHRTAARAAVEPSPVPAPRTSADCAATPPRAAVRAARAEPGSGPAPGSAPPPDPTLPYPGPACGAAEAAPALRSLAFRAEAGALAVAAGANPDFHAAVARVLASSPLRPDVPLDVDLATGRVAHAARAAGVGTGAGSVADGASARDDGGLAGVEGVWVTSLDPGPDATERPAAGAAAAGATAASLAPGAGAAAAADGAGAGAPAPRPGGGAAGRGGRAARHAHGGYACWVEAVRAPDGARVPLTVARAEAGGPPGPALLAVYGCYGLPLDVGFRPEYASLLARTAPTYTLSSPLKPLKPIKPCACVVSRAPSPRPGFPASPVVANWIQYAQPWSRLRLNHCAAPHLLRGVLRRGGRSALSLLNMTHAPAAVTHCTRGARRKRARGGARAQRPQPRPPPPQDGHTPTRADPYPSQRPAEMPAW